METTIVCDVSVGPASTQNLSVHMHPLEHGNLIFRAVVNLSSLSLPLRIISVSTRNGTWTENVGWQIYSNTPSNPSIEKEFVAIVIQELVGQNHPDIPLLWKLALTHLPLQLN